MSKTIYVDREELKQLSVARPSKTVMAIAFDWAVIVAMTGMSIWSQSWIVYLVAVFVIAGRQHALAVLIHDFAHYRFLANKRLSEWIGDIFLAWPILITVNSYRTTHMEHHFHTNTEQDPDYVPRLSMKTYRFPMNIWFLFTALTGYLATITSIYDVLSLHTKKMANTQDRMYVWARLSFYAVIGIVVGYTGIWREFLLYWIIPFVTVFFALNYARGVAEHFSAMDYSTLEGGTRTIIPYLWERAFFCPHNVNYHSEHHLYPGVPFYNLPILHEKMMQNHEYRKTAHITRGYSTGLVGEMISDSYKRPAYLDKIVSPS